MMMILDLPRELVMEIFSRVPLKSMRKVRLSCKTLNTLSKSESFSKMHLVKEKATKEGEYSKVVLLDYKLSLMSVIVDEDKSKEAKVKLSWLNNQQVKIFKIFHCDGLLLCILKDSRKIVVWNPYWGQTRWIEPRYTHPFHFGKDLYSYALGYSNGNNHKLLRFLDDIRIEGEWFQWYEIYHFDTDKWTTLDVPGDWSIWNSHPGVSLKGNTYFIASKANATSEFHDHLICFDYTRESFGPLMHLPFEALLGEFVTLSCVREDKLAVLLKHEEEVDPYGLDIWITTKIEFEEVTWSKFLTMYTEPYYPISCGGFFIDEGKKVVMGFDESEQCSSHHTLSIVWESGYLKRFKLKEYVNQKYWHRQVCSYVPSLVQIKQPPGGGKKRKHESNLEQRRYDEKMLRLVQLQKQLEGGSQKEIVK